MTSCTCRCTAAKSIRGSAASMPNGALTRMACAVLAAASIALDGTHPVFRHSPPISPRSIRTTRAPSCAAIEAALRTGGAGANDTQVDLKIPHVSFLLLAAAVTHAVLLQFLLCLFSDTDGDGDGRDQPKRK